MQKNLTQLKCLVNSKEIFLSCDVECNTIEVKEALCQFIRHVVNVEDAHQAKLKADQDQKVEIFEEPKIEPIEA